MAVTTSTASAGPYVGDGETTRFSFGFPVIDTKHVAVYVNGDRITGGVSIVKGTNGGEVVFSTAPAEGRKIVILRNMPFTQETDLQNNTAFLPEVLEQAFDKLTMICQQLQETVERAIKWPPAMEGEPLPEHLLTQAIAAAAEVAKAAKLFNEDFADKKTVLEMLYEKTLESLVYVGCMTEDTELSLNLIWPESGDELKYAENRKALQDTVDALPRNLGGYTLTLEVPHWVIQSSYGEPLRINGFYNGKVVLQDMHASNVKDDLAADIEALRISNCTCPVIVAGLNANGLSTEGPAVVYVSDCLSVVFRSCHIDAWVGGAYEGEGLPEGYLGVAAAVVSENSHIRFSCMNNGDAGDNTFVCRKDFSDSEKVLVTPVFAIDDTSFALRNHLEAIKASNAN